MKKKTLLSVLLLILSFSFTAEALKDTKQDVPFNQYYVRAKKKMNVRSAPNTSSEIMYMLEKSEDALVIDESGDWLKIKPKEGFNPWVHKDMVEKSVIDKDNVNVRVGPSTESSSLGKLSEGEPVIILKTEGEWHQIELPRGYGFWVANGLVKFLCPANNYQKFLEDHKLAIQAFMNAEDVRKKELMKRYMDVDYDAIVKAYQGIIDNYPDTPEALKSQERIMDAREKKAMSQQRTLTMEELRKSLALFEEAEDLYKKYNTEPSISTAQYDELLAKYKDIADHYASSPEGKNALQRMTDMESFKKENKVVEAPAEGAYLETAKLKVYKEKNGYTEATHMLAKGTFGKNILCAVYCKNTDLRAFEKKNVEIEGRIVTPASDILAYPLVEIVKITLKRD